MIPYHYSVVRCRDADVAGEQRNVGLLVVSAVLRKAWLRRGNLIQRAHLVGDEATFVRALLDAMEEEAVEVAREGDAARVHDWLRSRSRPTEDSVSLSAPALGIASDPVAECARLAAAYLGGSGGGGRTAAEKLRLEVLRAHGLQRRFQPRHFVSGPAVWKFASVSDLPGGPLVFNALQFAQSRPEGVIESAWNNVGRAAEVRHYHPETRWITVAVGPQDPATGRAFGRALHVMRDGGLNVVEPTPGAVEAALARFGLLAGDGAAEAK